MRRPPERLPGGRVMYPPSFWIPGDCNLFRAAIIRIENMPQPLPALERSATLWDKRAGPLKSDPVPQG